MKERMIIGIAGGSGSGKTTLARNIVEHFGDRISILRHDDYYKSQKDIPAEERPNLNYDHPDAFDTDLLIKHLDELRAGRSVKSPVYDYSVHDRSDKTRLVESTDVIILEGAYNGNTYASLAEIKTQISNYDYSLNMGAVKYVKEGGTAQLGAITDTTKDVAFAGMHAKYTSSDESIVKVDKYGTLTWVKNGMAKITAEFMGETQTCDVISGVVDFEDGVVPSALKFTGARVASFTATDMNDGKVMEVKSVSDAYGDVCVIMPRDIYGVFFEDPTVQYLALSLSHCSNF